jgi:hypothetical protein
MVRMIGVGAQPGQFFLTFSGSPAGVYKWQVADFNWKSVSGKLFWLESNQSTTGFNTVDGAPVALRNLAAHPRQSNVWAAVSNRYTYMTTDGGQNWVVGVQPRPPGSTAGAYLLTSVDFDPTDPTGNTYYLTTLAAALVDAQNDFHPYPTDFGHVFRTNDAGRSWKSLGAQDLARGGLPNVGANVIKVDPDDPTGATLYVGTEIGLYRSTDSGATWSRFGAGTLPLVEVTDICLAGSQRLAVSTYGRGFWEIYPSGSAPAGVLGNGDFDNSQVIDGFDLVREAATYQTDPSFADYNAIGNLVGTTNFIDDADVTALINKLGGRP